MTSCQFPHHEYKETVDDAGYYIEYAGVDICIRPLVKQYRIKNPNKYADECNDRKIFHVSDICNKSHKYVSYKHKEPRGSKNNVISL